MLSIVLNTWSMRRVAFKMQLHKGFETEYQRRHDALWPAMKLLLQSSGISDYSIFLDEVTGSLFGVLNVADEEAYDKLPAHPLMQKWWQFMQDIMDCNADHSPVSTPLQEMFHLP
jgi:L-rhamnose mutarotase